MRAGREREDNRAGSDEDREEEGRKVGRGGKMKGRNRVGRDREREEERVGREEERE